MPIKRTNLEIHEVSLCRKGANPGAKVILAKSMETDSMTVEELTKQVADLTAERDQLKAEIEKSAEKPEDVLEKASPELRELIQKAQAEAEAAKAESAKTAAALAKAERTALEKSVSDRIEKLKDVAGGEEDKTDLIKMAVEMSEDQREFMFKTLEKANTIASKGMDELSKEKGDSVSKDSLTAVQEIEKKAQEIVTKDPKCSLAKARTMVRDADSELAERERAELKERK